MSSKYRLDVLFSASGQQRMHLIQCSCSNIVFEQQLLVCYTGDFVNEMYYIFVIIELSTHGHIHLHDVILFAIFSSFWYLQICPLNVKQQSFNGMQGRLLSVKNDGNCFIRSIINFWNLVTSMKNNINNNTVASCVENYWNIFDTIRNNGIN